MIFGNSNSTGDILTGCFLGSFSWISTFLYGLIIYDSIGAIKNNCVGMNGQQNVTKFYQLLSILIQGLLGISLNFVLRFQLWIGPESDWAQSIAFFPYIQPFFWKIMFIITAALLCLFTSLQLPLILAQFGFQHRQLFAWPSIVLPLVLCFFLSQMEIPDLRIYSWIFHECKLATGSLFSFASPHFSELMDLFSVYVVNKNNPILKPSLINTNAFLLFATPIIVLVFFSICAVVSLTILLFNLKKRRTALMKDFNLISDIDEIQRKKIQELEQQIKTAVLNVVQVSILILFLYFPLLNGFIYFFIFFYLEKYQAPNTKDIYYPMYYVDINNNFTPELYYVGINNKSKPVTAINSNNLTHLLAALFIVVPLLNFVFSTASRQQKIKIWLHNCWNNFSKKWKQKMRAKPFIVMVAVSLLAILVYYCYLIGTVFNDFTRYVLIGCNDTLFNTTSKADGINPLTYWAFLLLNLLFTHSIVKFAWNQIGTLTILNFHFGELLRVAFDAYENLPWCGPFRPVYILFGFPSYTSVADAYIYQIMLSIYPCIDWTPLLIALHRFHIIMVPIQANHFWSKKRIIKACITFWMVMSILAVNFLHNSLSAYKAQDLFLYKIILFLEYKLFIFICFLYAIMFCKFTWEALFSTSVQILSSSNQLHETRSEMIRITMACFLSYWLPRYVDQRAKELEYIADLKSFNYIQTIMRSNYFIVEAISLMILSKQYRKIVFADLQLLPLLVSKLWKRLSVSRNQIQQMPQNNNVNGRNQMSNGWVGNLETTQ